MDAAQRNSRLESVTELVKLAIKSAEGGQWDAAIQHLDEAGSAFWTIPPEHPDTNKRDARWCAVGAAIEEGKGQLALRAGQIPEGAFHLDAGVKLRLEEEAAGGTPPPMALLVGLVNLTGAYHRLGRFEEALKANALALERLQPIDSGRRRASSSRPRPSVRQPPVAARPARRGHGHAGTLGRARRPARRVRCPGRAAAPHRDLRRARARRRQGRQPGRGDAPVAVGGRRRVGALRAQPASRPRRRSPTSSRRR